MIFVHSQDCLGSEPSRLRVCLFGHCSGREGSFLLVPESGSNWT